MLGDAGRYFSDAADVAAVVDAAEADVAGAESRRTGARARELARRYDWDDVAAGYEELAQRWPLAAFPTRRPSGRRDRTATDVAPGARVPSAPAHGRRAGDLAGPAADSRSAAAGGAQP